VPRRIEVTSANAVAIPADVLDELYKHAVEAAPDECCGLIVGDEVRRYRQVHRCRNDMTAKHQGDPVAFPRDARTAFYMNEHDYMTVQKGAAGTGRQVTAVYHSHVGAGAYLSEMDLAYAESELFPFPGADQIVVPVHDGKVGNPGIFVRAADGFSGHPVRRIEA
jgi:proteasome lid subunit RPN8/RPN11